MRTRSRKKSKPVIKEEMITFIDGVDAETQCSVCAAEFLDEEDLKLHVKQMHLNETQGNTMCSFCGAFFSGLDEFVIHFIYSHLEKMIFCFYCYRGFMDRVSFAKHELKHYAVPDDPTITCSQCPQVFSNRHELQKHEFSAHRDSDGGVLLNHAFSLLSCALNIQITKFIDSISKNKKITCTICNHRSANVTNYMEHLKITNCQSFTCDKCFRVYKTKNGVSNHFLSHPECQNYSEKGKQGQCSKCDKYIDISNFKEHKKSCQAEKCSACKEIFNSVHELTEHRVKDHQIALSVSLQTCKFCKKELVGVYNLQKHINRAHKNCNLYKYPCIYCGIFYMHPRRLFAHYFTRHKDIYPYTCKICDIKFRLRKKFTIHIKLEHKSVGFVEFDDKLNVIFSDKKSEKPYKPQIPILNHNDQGMLDNVNTELLSGKQKSVPKQDKAEVGDEQKYAENDGKKIIQMAKLTEGSTEDFVATDTIEATDTNSQGSDEVSLLKIKTHLLKQNVEDDVYEMPLILRRKRKPGTRQQSVPKKVKRTLTGKLSDDFSDDEPLSYVRRSLKTTKTKSKNITSLGGRIRLRNKTAKLTCKICNKYCYTFQNYHHHMTLHEKSKLKRCVKCHECFKSKTELQCHIHKAHSSSKLTETLKFLLEKRKQTQKCADKSTPRPAETLKSLLEQRKKTQLMNAQNSVSNKFRRTVKKVHITDECTATITPMSDHGLSVKNFIENFRPDGGEIVSISNSVTIKTIMEPLDKPSIIKMYKFNNEPPINDGKLCLPVKFKDHTNCLADSKSNVSVKLVQQLITKPKLLNFIVDEKIPLIRPKPQKVQNNEYCNTFADATDYTQYKNETTIPDVAHEVVMGDADDVPRTKQLAQEIIIPNIPEKYGGVSIGHLLPEAPYYKIVKVKKLLKAANPKESESEEEVPDNNIKLPDGTQLVTVKNPFSHLIPNEHLNEILKGYKNKYYTPKVKNIERALFKALNNKKKHKPSGNRRKMSKVTNPDEDTVLKESIPKESMVKKSIPSLLPEEITEYSVSHLNILEDTISEQTVHEQSISDNTDNEASSSGKSIKADSVLQETLEEVTSDVRTTQEGTPEESITNKNIMDESISNKPVQNMTVLGKPISEELVSREMNPEESISGELMTEDSVTDEPVHEESVTVELVHEESITAQPVHEESVTGIRAPVDSVTGNSVLEVLVPGEKVPEESVTGEPAPEESQTGEPVPEESVTGKSVPEESVTGKSVSVQLILEEPVTEKWIPGELIPEESISGVPIKEELILGELIPEESISVNSGEDESIAVKPVPEESVSGDAINVESIPEELIPEETMSVDPIKEEWIREESNLDRTISGDPINESIPGELIPKETISEDTSNEISAPRTLIPEASISGDPIKEELIPGGPDLEPTISGEPILGDAIPAEWKRGELIQKELVSSRVQPKISYLKFSDY